MKTPTAIGSILAIAAAAAAHTDDPKGKAILPAYDGPGYRAAEDAAAGLSFPRQNVTLMAWVTVLEFGGQIWANDCWGYTSPSGREYAIIGLSGGTGFVEITDPGDPVILGVIPGGFSTWRDIKVHDHYAYSVTETAGDGIQVIDLAFIDEGEIALVNTIGTGGTTSTHNVAINGDSGFLYRCGGANHGLRVYDLIDPFAPQFVGEWADRYVHDAQIVSFTEGPYAGMEVAFVCAGFNGGNVDTGLGIIDVTDKQNMHLIAWLEYPQPAYSHQGWLTGDRQYFILNDEADETAHGIASTHHVIDVSDLSNPAWIGSFTNGSPAITHNLYTRGEFVFAANYRSGLRIFDASDAANAVEVGYFDTVIANDDPTFNGLWSNYPYFPSGTVIGSDREKGLFVWQVDLGGIPGDLDGDGTVSTADLLALIAAWGPCAGCPEDLNGNGNVGTFDLLILLGNWG